MFRIIRVALVGLALAIPTVSFADETDTAALERILNATGDQSKIDRTNRVNPYGKVPPGSQNYLPTHPEDKDGAYLHKPRIVGLPTADNNTTLRHGLRSIEENKRLDRIAREHSGGRCHVEHYSGRYECDGRVLFTPGDPDHPRPWDVAFIPREYYEAVINQKFGDPDRARKANMMYTGAAGNFLSTERETVDAYMKEGDDGSDTYNILQLREDQGKIQHRLEYILNVLFPAIQERSPCGYVREDVIVEQRRRIRWFFKDARTIKVGQGRTGAYVTEHFDGLLTIYVEEGKDGPARELMALANDFLRDISDRYPMPDRSCRERVSKHVVIVRR